MTVYGGESVSRTGCFQSLFLFGQRIRLVLMSLILRVTGVIAA